jgi:hypothetical protein
MSSPAPAEAVTGNQVQTWDVTSKPLASTSQTKKKKKKNAGLKVQETPAPSNAPGVKEKAKKLFEELKVQTRTKFRSVLSIINKIREAFPQATGRITKNGSHFVFHGEGQKFVSLVRPHGGDPMIPPQRLNLFTARLIEHFMESQ